MIKILMITSIILVMVNFIAYDFNRTQNQKVDEQRTRIIAGMPVDEKDYKLPRTVLNEEQTIENN